MQKYNKKNIFLSMNFNKIDEQISDFRNKI